MRELVVMLGFKFGFIWFWFGGWVVCGDAVMIL